MRILQIIPYLNPRRGGDVAVCANLSECLANEGHEVTIATTDFEYDKSLAESLRTKGITIVVFPCISTVGFFLFSPSIKKWLCENLPRFDVVHLHNYRTYQNAVVAKYACAFGVPYVLQAHGSLRSLGIKKTLKWAFDTIWGRRIIRNASALVALTKTEASDYAGLCSDTGRIATVPNGVSSRIVEYPKRRGEFRKRIGIDPGDWLIVYLGRIHRTKGVDLLLEAFASDSRLKAKARLIIAGPDSGCLEELRARSISLGIDSRVRFLGFISEEEKYGLLADSDVLVLPKYSGFPVVFVEACAIGVPVVTTDKGDELEWIHNRVGFVVAYDKEEVGQAIRRILSNQEERTRMSLEGIAIARKEFDWRLLANRYASIYRDACVRWNHERSGIVVVAPSLLEPLGSLGGGIEEVDLRMSLALSESYSVTILGPRGNRNGAVRVNESNWLSVVHVAFPALTRYPPASLGEHVYIAFFLTPVYSIALAVKFLSMLSAKLKLVVIHNGLPGVTVGTIARLAGLKVIYSEGNLYPWTHARLSFAKRSLPRSIMRCINRALGYFLCLISDSIRVQSDLIRDGMIQCGVDMSKILVIRAGVDVDEFGPRLSNRDFGKFRVGFIGRLTDEKGARLLAEVVRTASLELPNVQFIIIGDGPCRNLFRSVPNVDFIGQVERTKVAKWISEMNAFVFPQLDLSLTVLQTMASAKPVICLKNSDASSVIVNGSNGILVEPTPHSFVEAIRELSGDPSFSKTLGSNARQSVLKFFDWNLIGRQWKSLIKKFIDEDYEESDRKQD